MKRIRLSFTIVSTGIILLLAAAGALIWLAFRAPSAPLSASPDPAPSPPPSARAPLPDATPPPSELRGRRGIIREIAGNRIVVETTDLYATPGERVQALVKPATTFVLISIPRFPGADQEKVIRTPLRFSDLSTGNDLYVISFRDITASSTFSALRIEKIVTP